MGSVILPSTPAGIEQFPLHLVDTAGNEIPVAGRVANVVTTNGGKNTTFEVSYCFAAGLTGPQNLGIHFLGGNELCGYVNL